MPNIEKLRKANMNQAYPKEVNDEMGKRHPYGDELALIRKELHHIEMALNIAPTNEFAEYYNEAETTKADVKERFK